MSPERFKQAETIFQAACDIPAAERHAFVERSCGHDLELHQHVRALLRHDERPVIPLHSPLAEAVRDCAGTLGEAGHPAIPLGEIGSYRILRQLGEGGFGVVYLAEQENPRRNVALKIIRPEKVSRDVLRRFRHEAHILGQLQHPCIAQIYEADTARVPLSTGGAVDRPFFAMEYVAGSPLTDYARTRNLSIEHRLELVARVCDAVQHAHRRGIIHRDLKPANILVADGDEKGRRTQDSGLSEKPSHAGHPSVLTPRHSVLASAQPKILDFGVARVIDADEHVTRTHTGVGQLVGTLPYMSPEQVSGDPAAVDTRCDVYALGLILFEVLVGRLPYDLKSCSIPEAVRRITTESPPRLGSVDRRFRGEIEIVVTKALEKEPSQRYQSASELAGDLRRYLAGEPIEARPHSSIYVLRKAIRRHRGAVAAAVAFVVLLAVFAVVSFVQARQNLRLADRETHARLRADEKAAELDRSLYLSRIGYAQAAYHNGDTGRMKSLLDACAPARRGWEWFFLHRLSDRSRATLQDRSTPGLNGAVLDREGRFILTCGLNQLVRLRNARSLEDLLVIPSEEWIERFVLDPARSRIALAAGDGRVVVHDRTSGREVMGVQHAEPNPGGPPPGVRSCAYSPDGRYLASGGLDGIVRLWDAETGEPRATLARHGDDVMDVQFSPDSSQILSAGADNFIQLWDIASGVQLESFQGSGDHFVAVAFHPDGRHAVSGGNDGCMRIWDLTAGQQIAGWCDPKTQVACVAFSPDGRWLSCGTRDYLIRLWDASLGWGPGAPGWDEPHILRGHVDQLRSVAFARDSDTGQLELISASWDGAIKWWAVPPSPDVGVVTGDGSQAYSAQFSADGRWLAASQASGQVLLVDAKSKFATRSLPLHSGQVISVTFSADGRRLASAGRDEVVAVTDVLRQEPHFEFKAERVAFHCVVFSAGDTQIIAGGADGVVRVFDIAGPQQPRLLSGHGSVVNAVAVTRDGRRLVSASDDQTLKVWDLPAGRELLTFPGHAGRVFCCALTPDEREVVSASDDGAVKKWRLDTGEDVWSSQGHRGPALDVAVSPDGSRVASCGRDRTVRLWDAATGEEILTLRGHTLMVQSVAFSPDGVRLVSSSDDGTLRFWDSGPR